MNTCRGVYHSTVKPVQLTRGKGVSVGTVGCSITTVPEPDRADFLYTHTHTLNTNKKAIYTFL